MNIKKRLDEIINEKPSNTIVNPQPTNQEIPINTVAPKSKDVLGEVFSSILLVFAIFAFLFSIGAVINAFDSNNWLIAIILFASTIILFFLYWLIRTFSKIYTTLKDIDCKLSSGIVTISHNERKL